MVEFSGGKELHPFSWVIGAEDAEISLEFLIGSFSLSVGLRVVGGGKSYVVVEETCKFPCEGRSELRTMIRDEGVVKTEVFEYEVKKQLGNPCSVNGLLTRCKNYPLSKAMVDHDHDRIKSRGGREVSDEVNRELFKGERDGGLDREERRDNGVSIGLVLLANGTTNDEMFHKGGEAWPPEILFQNRFGVKDTHVTR